MTRKTENPEVPVALARGLVRTYGEERALDGLDLTVHAGECLGLLGPNGAGKTTTLRILSTLTLPTEGEVRVFGLDPETHGHAIRERLGVVPQEVALYDALTARENLAFFAEMYGLAGARLGERVRWALGIAGLEDRADSHVATYSGGMKRRLNIVAALLHEPELVFLDEPTVGVDPQSRNHIFEMIEAMHAAGTTLIYTTHQLGEVERLCDRIVVMDSGRSIAEGSLAELQGIDRAGQAGRRDGAAVHLESQADVARVKRLLAEHEIAHSVEDHAPNLEEIFLGLTGHALRDES